MMKKIILTAVFALLGLSCMGTMIFNKSANEQEKSVRDLWKDYNSAEGADRPQKQMDILTMIKDLSRKQGLLWDFWQASEMYVEVGSQRNWKQRNEFIAAREKEILDLNQPLVTFFYKKQQNDKNLLGYINEQKSTLEAGVHKDFWLHGGLTGLKCAGLIPNYIRSDYEFALWAIVCSSSSEVSSARAELSSLLDGAYPQTAILELGAINRYSSSSREALNAFAEKYAGKAAELMAREDLMWLDFNKLQEDKNSRSDDYKALRARGVEFEKKRKEFTGDEKSIVDYCIRVQILIETLDKASVQVSIEDGVAEIITSNAPEVELNIKKDDKSISRHQIPNPVGSYFVKDTISFRLPDIDDGSYTVTCSYGKEESEISYEKYTLSLALKHDSKGYGIFVADFKTGEPVTGVDVALYDNDKKIALCENLSLKGFTYLPESIVQKIDPKRNWEQAIEVTMTDGGRLRKTHSERVNPRLYAQSGDDRIHGVIFKDRAAFNPGETVQFKTIIYMGDGRGKYSVLADESLTARLIDPKGNSVKTLSLKTNEYGSAAGSFLLERGERNGIYRISIEQYGGSLCSTSLRVDDFVLPTFSLSFENNDQLYLPGDRIEMKGRILAYSGHTLGSAKVTYIINSYGETVDEGEIKLADDGTFSVCFDSDPTSGYRYYDLTVKVTDGTGETLEWSRGIAVREYIPFNLSLTNGVEARCADFSNVINSDEMHLLFKVTEDGSNLDRNSLKISYSVIYDGKVINSGNANSGEEKSLLLDGYPSGLYTVRAIALATDAAGEPKKTEAKLTILKLKDDDTVLNAPIENVFKVIDGDGIAIQMGAGLGPVWAVVELYGDGLVPYVSELVHLEGISGQEGSLKTLRYDYKSSWSDKVQLKIMYFRNGEVHSYTRIYDRTDEVFSLPLSFTRVEDRTVPRSAYSFQMKTGPEAECVATIYDKSTETIMSNNWNRVYLSGLPAPSIDYSISTGTNSGSHRYMLYNDRMVAAAAPTKAMKANAALGSAVEVEEEAMMMDEAPVPSPDSDDDIQNGTGDEIAIRDNFSGTVAFEPFLVSDADGLVDFNFTTTDKLSTYYVSVFAHNKSVQNSVIRREMKITIPVKVAIVEPQGLYEGDRYLVKATVSSTLEEPVDGTVIFSLYPGADYKTLPVLAEKSVRVSLKALGSESVDLPIDVPAIRDLGIKVTFVPDEKKLGGDAVFVSVPVSPGIQTITEAHSAILHAGGNADQLITALRSEFVNFPGAEADVTVTKLIEMVRNAIPGHIDIKSKDAISLSDALYACLLTERLAERETELFGQTDVKRDSLQATESQIVASLMKCLRPDGGYSWFEGMSSSAIVTATILGRYAALIDRGLTLPGELASNLEKTVHFLDRTYFDESGVPFWCGSISMEQYLYIRSMFADVSFNATGATLKGWKEFKKDAKAYLIPKDKRGLNANIFGKSRRISTLMRLAGSDSGVALARNWGIRFGSAKKLTKSITLDCESLLEYAIPHKSGGIYYPNAVMPFRGLLESELYAHAQICNLMKKASDLEGLKSTASTLKDFNGQTEAEVAAEIAEGIRLWIMVQKETQQWDNDPACLEALTSVLDGAAETLNTEVISLVASGEKPFESILKSGNGFTVERRFYLVSTITSDDGKKHEGRTLISEGDILHVGDNVVGEYRIWNEENRSFVRLNAPRPACMRPVKQLSGAYGWWLSPLRVNGWYNLSPQGYRNVLPTGTEYWFDTYPEENTTITEEFFVTQEGAFKSPVLEIECLYAPHYRANDSGQARIIVQ